MNKHDKLQRIPPDDYSECGYADDKEMFINDFNCFINEVNCSVLQAVNSAYYHSFDTIMNENGMDKFIGMLAGMLFMIENDDVEADQAYGTNCDISDFETGKYDDLFTPEDLKLIKADIKIIKNYLSKHPELLKDESPSFS